MAHPRDIWALMLMIVSEFRGNLRLIQTDYHDLETLSRILRSGSVMPSLPFTPNAFVSLFSVECFHSTPEKYEFYEKIFKTFSTIEFGLVGGFFYEGRRGEEKVGETGNIVSYQTIEKPWKYTSNWFTEFRMHIRTPSKMFGPDVVEVWKFFIRK